LQVCKRTVIATVQTVGFHRWEAAPDEVHYLSKVHRHLFTVRAEFDVTHDERDVEFHIAQGWLRTALSARWSVGYHGIDFMAQSCETIAEELHAELLKAEHEASAVEVWEDGENGARVTW